MNSLSLIVLFHLFTGIHGKEIDRCKGYSNTEQTFSCLHRINHNKEGCMEIIKMTIFSAMRKNLPEECLVKLHKCTKECGNKCCTQEECRTVLSFSIKCLHNQKLKHVQREIDTCLNSDKVSTQNARINTGKGNNANMRDSRNCGDNTSSFINVENKRRNGTKHEIVTERIEDDENREDRDTEILNSQNADDIADNYQNDEKEKWKLNKNGERNEKKKYKDNSKKNIFTDGAIVGISVGISGTIILVLVILAIVYVCRRRSKKKKRKHLTKQQAINQRLQIKRYERGSFSTNKGGYNVLSADIPFVADEAQGEYFVPSIMKYDKELSNRKLPEIKKCSGAEGDDNVYYEIDEDKIKSSTDIDGVYQNKIKEFNDKGSYHSDQTRSEIQLGLMKKKMEQLTKQQSIDQRSEIASLESSTFSTNNRANTNTILFANESLNTDEEQGEYFVLDPSITKYDKDLSRLDLPKIKRFSVGQDDERVYNEIDEDEVQPPTDIKGVRQKKIEVKVKCSYNGDQNRSTKDTSKQQRRPQSVDQRTEIDIQNSSSGDKVIMSVNESLNTDEEQGEYFVLDPLVTKYDRDVSNLVLPEVKRFSVAQGDEKVYNKIDEGKFESSTDMQVDHQKQIEGC